MTFLILGGVFKTVCSLKIPARNITQIRFGNRLHCPFFSLGHGYDCKIVSVIVLKNRDCNGRVLFCGDDIVPDEGIFVRIIRICAAFIFLEVGVAVIIRILSCVVIKGIHSVKDFPIVCNAVAVGVPKCWVSSVDVFIQVCEFISVSISGTVVGHITKIIDFLIVRYSVPVSIFRCRDGHNICTGRRTRGELGQDIADIAAIVRNIIQCAVVQAFTGPDISPPVCIAIKYRILN